MDTLALTPELEPMSWHQMLEQMVGRESRGALVSASTKRDSAEMASQQVMAQGGRSSRGARHAGRAERNGCANKQMPGRWRQIATINFGVRARVSYPVCHPARPKRIGSGNRRLENPSPITPQSTARDSNQLLPVGWAELSPSSSH